MKLKNKKNKIRLKINRKNYNYNNGVINITNQGYAFVKIEKNNKTIFIPKNKVNRSLEGDIVKIRFKKNINKVKIKGEVIKILKRKTKKFIGILKINSNNNFSNYIDPSNRVKSYKNFIVCNKIIINIPSIKSNKYKHNDKVLVKIISWPQNVQFPIGKILKVFGKIGEYKTELYSLLNEYKISYKFSKKIKDEAKKIFSKGIFNSKSILEYRKDMRNINTFTIDPKNAKDFDDAISIREIRDKIWEIGVHISDVTHFIKEDSELDREAYIRNTSIYLSEKVIPMLPNLLSNELCSLKPKKDKLGFSVIFNMNEKGEVLKSWIGKTIIRSNKKFSYDEVQRIINEKKGSFYKEINTLFFLSKILIKNRLNNGSIFLDRIEVKFQLDHKKNPISIILEKNNEAHSIIEEFMLLTNKKISEFVSLKSNGIIKKPYIYRIHDKPDYEKIFFLKKIIQPLGYFLDLKNIKNSINYLLKKIKGKPEQNMIENLILRSMNKAKYSTKNIGHYGLSFIHYTHFTSPIRRYSDMIAHRLLNYYLVNNYKKIKSIDFYEKQSQYCSYKERIVIDVERDFLKYIQIKFLTNFLGQEFDGIITGFTEWGVYIDLISFQTEGLIKFRDIEEDNYTLDSNGYSIIGKNNKKSYLLGDKVKVKLINIDIEKKRIILNWIKK
ncbi:ribonuclease R [Blattabacterium cuenoti]|uniref:ribonuclease R n=1 Tax=Blattabacterium cuenoti TaxID=1653831 RepID=UPI00163D3362|nr:ribonuclease R [Blattabacterium cuenoti]